MDGLGIANNYRRRLVSHAPPLHLLPAPLSLPGGEVLVGGRVPAEDHPCHCEDVFLHGPGHEDSAAAAGTVPGATALWRTL